MQKHLKLTSLLTLMIMLLTTGFVLAAEDLLDPNIPESWNQGLKTASEMGITEFNQSPIFNDKVESGELPPVEERLCEDPPVIEPYKNVGKYGGRFNIYSTVLGNGFGQYMRLFTAPLKPAPNGNSVIPWYAKSYEYNDEYTEITLHFRKGIKWSDGYPFIPEDEYKFWWTYYLNDEDVNPQGGRNIGVPTITKLTYPDKYSVTFHLAKPFPLKHKADFRFTWGLGNMPGTNLAPKHVMKKYQPQLVGKEEALKRIKAMDLEDLNGGFTTLWEQSSNPTDPDYNIPTLSPYVPVKRTETYILYERNPYYPFVDTEGNQLPYVDELKNNLANSKNAAEIKAITGEATIATEDSLTIENIPSYIQNEKKGDYRTLIFNMTNDAYPYYFFNLNNEDESFQNVVQDKRFRQAFSLALDREAINKKIYYGKAVPCQATIPATSDYYKEEYAQAYADYDPETAMKLLDDIGMVDVDGDGFRETPDGKKFNPELQLQGAAFDGPMGVHEMVKSDLADIGIDLDIKSYDGSLAFDRIQSNQYQMESHSLDPTMPLFGPEIIKKIFAPINVAWIAGPWVQWANWYRSNGEQGIKPPEEVIELDEAAEQYLYGSSKKEREAGITKLLESQAENLWGIGTVAHPPQPIIVQNKVKNVPEKGYLGWGLGWMYLYNPIQFYIDE